VRQPHSHSQLHAPTQTQRKKADAHSPTLPSAHRYLHSIGEIIFLGLGQGLQERIIIDPQWFCTTVMGRLSEPQSMQDLSAPHRIGDDGRISRVDLVKRLQLDEISKASAELAMLVLEEHLLLCSRVDGGGEQYIVPVLLRTPSGQELCFEAPHEGWSAVCGRRFVCEGDTEALSPGFFPKLQAALPRRYGCMGTKYSQGGLWLVIGMTEVLLWVSPTLTSESCACVCVCVCVCVSSCVVDLTWLDGCRLRGAHAQQGVEAARQTAAAGVAGDCHPRPGRQLPRPEAAVPGAQCARPVLRPGRSARLAG
jgi:hypothetical protein